LLNRPAQKPKDTPATTRAARDLLAFAEALDCDDCLLDAVESQDPEVHQPGFADRCLWLAPSEFCIDRVTDEYLEVGDRREARGG
jgi:hypothetical protein